MKSIQGLKSLSGTESPISKSRKPRITKVIVLILLLFTTLTLVVYDIRFNYDGYDILLRNRFTKLGFGIHYKEGFEIWHFAHTVHGGIAEKRLFPNFSQAEDKDGLEPYLFLDTSRNLNNTSDKESKKVVQDSMDWLTQDLEFWFQGYKTTYKDWIPFISEVAGRPALHKDSLLFLETYQRELEKEYGISLDGHNIKLKEFDDYFAKRAEKEGKDILMTALIKDFYVERGLLPKTQTGIKKP